MRNNIKIGPEQYIWFIPIGICLVFLRKCGRNVVDRIKVNSNGLPSFCIVNIFKFNFYILNIFKIFKSPEIEIRICLCLPLLFFLQ